MLVVRKSKMCNFSALNIKIEIKDFMFRLNEFCFTINFLCSDCSWKPNIRCPRFLVWNNRIWILVTVEQDCFSGSGVRMNPLRDQESILAIIMMTVLPSVLLVGRSFRDGQIIITCIVSELIWCRCKTLKNINIHIAVINDTGNSIS